MEQKKLLLVAISVGVFFVIVIGTALVFLKPAADMVSVRDSLVSTASSPISYIPPGRPPVPETDQPFDDPSNGDSNPANDNYSSTSIEFHYQDHSTQTYIEDNSSHTLITVDARQAVGVPDVQGTSAASAVREAASSAANPTTGNSAVATPPVTTPAATTPATTTPATTVTTPASTTTTPPASTQTTPASSSVASSTAGSNSSSASTASGTSTAARTGSTPAAAPKTRDDYWIQTGAFTVLSGAESVKQTLADKGITSIIENRNIGDVLYFRVRIGPYTTQNEADYWLNLIKSINGFENSQVRLTKTIL